MALQSRTPQYGIGRYNAKPAIVTGGVITLLLVTAKNGGITEPSNALDKGSLQLVRSLALFARLAAGGSAGIYRIRIDRVSEANHDLILWLDQPVVFRVLLKSKYLFE